MFCMTRANKQDGPDRAQNATVDTLNKPSGLDSFALFFRQPYGPPRARPARFGRLHIQTHNTYTYTRHAHAHTYM